VLPQLSAEQVHAVLPWDALADALAQAFAAPPQAPVRTAHAMSAADTLLLMPAWDERAIGIKLVTVIPTASSFGGHTVDATYLLLDRATGAPQALLDGEALTVRRTAATSAVAARALAVPDPERLVVVGTGRLAPWMVRAYHALLPSLRHVALWGRDERTAEQLAAALLDEGIPVSPVSRLADAVAEGAPLLVLEAMKMEHVIKAPRAGTLAAVAYKVGDFVEDRAELVRFVVPAPAAK
jgi:ornithine cyclodeaminase